jgi:hypothetical protein
MRREVEGRGAGPQQTGACSPAQQCHRAASCAQHSSSSVGAQESNRSVPLWTLSQEQSCVSSSSCVELQELCRKPGKLDKRLVQSPKLQQKFCNKNWRR